MRRENQIFGGMYSLSKISSYILRDSGLECLGHKSCPTYSDDLSISYVRMRVALRNLPYEYVTAKEQESVRMSHEFL